ncbi:hypothetical protein GIB67_037182 [Kingdonia uniflora]|uniref:D-isomer specific 2-hydroxyacid dehydrogenase NAD-binding domain-containing protein n=1 Tax=Kingdonia uniflora TaxID=39325 RepID=A0A7J7MRP0_9MAGN|nr:hypothetical protein GIB67_037182 [Kingdonia uniflora]
MGAMMALILTLTTKNPSSDRERSEGDCQNLESTTTDRGRGKGVPMGGFMCDARNAGINPLNPTLIRVVRRGKGTMFLYPTREIFYSYGEGEETLLSNTFNRLHVDIESEDKFVDSHDEEGFIDSSQRSARINETTSDDYCRGRREDDPVTYQLQYFAPNSPIGTNNVPATTTAFNNYNRGLVGYIEKNKGIRVIVGKIIRVLQIDTYRGRRPQDTNQGEQIASAVITAIRTVGQDVKLNIPEFDGKVDANGFMEWLNKVDRILMYKRYGDPKSIILLETKLTEYALNWWNSLENVKLKIVDKYANEFYLFSSQVATTETGTKTEAVEMAKCVETKFKNAIPATTLVPTTLTPTMTAGTRPMGRSGEGGKSGRPSITFPTAARRMDTLNDLLAASDLISLHCALSNETVQIINAECLQHIKPGAFLVNTGSTQLLDDCALKQLLIDGTIAGCALDGAEGPQWMEAWV